MKIKDKIRNLVIRGRKYDGCTRKSETSENQVCRNFGKNEKEEQRNRHFMAIKGEKDQLSVRNNI